MTITRESHPRSYPDCGNCRFYEPMDEEDSMQGGWCERYPPQIILGKTGDPYSTHPRVSEIDWCGEFSLGTVLQDKRIPSP